MLIIAGMLFFPPTANQLLDKFNIADHNRKGIRFVGGLGLFVIGMMVTPNTGSTALKPESAKAEPKTRREIVEGFFSGWDGSHRGLESAVKESMNDPKSYEHVETRFRDDKETIFVVMKFRGKNAFGGTVLNIASGTIDGATGELIKWELND
jgi:hypothetical protein